MKYKKYGNILLIVSLIFIVYKLKDFRVDYYKYLQLKNILIIIGALIISTVALWLGGYGWKKVLKYCVDDNIDKSNISDNKLMHIYMQANLAKYIPGNVMQFIGKNILATEYNISQKKVAFSTVIDIALLVISSFIIVIALNPIKLIMKVLPSQYMYIYLSLIISGLLIVIIVGIWKKSLVKEYTKKVVEVSRKSICYYLACIILIGCSFAMIISIFEIKALSSFSLIVGAFIVSWLIGFITPGAPGGLGIREAVLIILIGGIVSSDYIMEAVLLHRIVSVLADIIAYLLSIVFKRREKIE